MDYKPVFETGIVMLEAPPSSTGLTAFTRQAVKTALAVSRNIAGLRHDLLGRVFHRILPAAKHTGAFYTSTTAATLLAGLAIPREGFDPEQYTLVDPACGTGTLLMAAAERIRQITDDRGKDISRRLIEKVIAGYDIELAATHMAAVTLGLMAPDVAFHKMNIHRPYLGVVNGQARCGSLELYDGQMSLEPAPASEQVETGEETLKAERHDLVIMNPPFTRDSLRYDHLGLGEERAIKAREKQLFRDTPADLSSSSDTFMLLADKLVGETEGTVAVILPAGFLGATSGQQMWVHLLKLFHLETVVISHDPQRIWFSENTGISETLLVFRRLNDHNRDLPTQFVKFSANPREVATALAVVGDLEKGRNPVGCTVRNHPRKKVLAGDWLPARFLSDFLVNCGELWLKDEAINVVPLGQVAFVGPAGRRTHDAYKKSVHSGNNPRRALWCNNTKLLRTLCVQPDTYIVVKTGKERKADNYWSQRGQLMLPVNTRLNTTRLVSVLVDEPVLGGGWVPVRPRDHIANPREWEKAMCVWLNSTPGLLAQIMVSTPNVLSRPRLSIDGQRRIPVPDLTEGQAARLAGVFDDQRDAVQERLTSVDGPRRVLDEAAAEVLGMDAEEVAVARRELAAEPAITGRRYGE